MTLNGSTKVLTKKFFTKEDDPATYYNVTGFKCHLENPKTRKIISGCEDFPYENSVAGTYNIQITFPLNESKVLVCYEWEENNLPQVERFPVKLDYENDRIIFTDTNTSLVFSDLEHIHQNKELLDNLTDISGILLYNGKPVGSGDGTPIEINNIDDASTDVDTTWSSTKINTELTKKSDISHTHDSRYYTEPEIDSKLTLKADTANVYNKTEVDNKLTGKSNTDHLHSELHTHTNKAIIDKFSHDGTNLLYDGTLINPGSGGTGGSADVVTYTNSAYPELTTVEAALDKLLYFAPQVTSLTNSVDTVEIGRTVTTLTLNWSLNKSVTNQSFNQSIGSISPSLRTLNLSNLSIASDTSYTLTVNDGSNSASSSTSVTFRHNRYWGVSSNTTLSNSEILAMSKEFATSKTQSKTFDCTGGKYFYIIYPETWGAATFRISGLAFSDFDLKIVSFTNSSGYTSNFRVYRSNNIQTGSAISVEVL